MSSESDDEDRSNFFQLRTFFENDCTVLLRNVMDEYFLNCAKLLEKIPREAYATSNPNGIISEDNEKHVKRDDASFKKFNFELLCVIFQTGVCDEFCGPPEYGWQMMAENFIENPKNTGEDILQIMQIWRQYLANNEEEEINNNDNEMIWNILYEVACRLSNTFSTYGKRFLKKITKKTIGRTTVYNQIGSSNSIKHFSSEKETDTIVCNQVGQENTFSYRNKIQRASKTISCTQVGTTNNIIIELDDQTKSKRSLSVESNGELRLTIHCTDPSFKEITDRIGQLSIEELNEDKFLRENSIQVVSTRSACLIIDARITRSNVDIPLSMRLLVEYLMRRCNAHQVLCDNNVDELRIFGYYYQPGDYIDETGMWLSMV